MGQTIKPSPLFVTLLLCLVTFIWTKSTSLHYVPSDAKPGHIVTTLTQQPQQTSQVHPSANDEGLKRFFTVLQKGSVITTSDVSSLEGQTIQLTILHEVEGSTWTENIVLQVANKVPKAYFTHSPYTGYISENEASGTEVQGLEELSQDLADFPYGCALQLYSGDVDYFELTGPLNGVKLLSTVMFNFEVKNDLNVVLKAHCAEGIENFARVTIGVLDVNDETPVFDQYQYNIDIDRATTDVDVPIYRILANDADSNEKVTYSMTGKDDIPFSLDPISGRLYVSDGASLTAEEYAFSAYATDKAGHRSMPAHVRITVYDSDLEIDLGNDISWLSSRDRKIKETDLVKDIPPVLNTHEKTIKAPVRHRRQATNELETRTFVVNENDQPPVALFSVASYPAVPEERYVFEEPAPVALTLEEESGLVTRETGHMWANSVEMFNVLVSRSDDPAYNETLPVMVYVVDRTWQSPVFTTQPEPLKFMMPVWIRPDTTLFTLQSLDAEVAGCDVWYRLESGADDTFYMDGMTGEVKVGVRQQFNADAVYELGISAQCIGTEAALSVATPAQLVVVEVEDVYPQFYYDPYIIEVSENSQANEVVDTIQVKSFQDLPITFEATWDDSEDSSYFSINGNTGEVTLLRDVTYITDKQQFRVTVKATEDNSLFESTQEVVINIIPENLHTPTFPPTHYAARGVSEDIATSEDILELFAIDLDPGELGIMNFTTTDDHFEVVSEDGKTGILRAARPLDYDFLGPDHKYEFQVIATDSDPVSPKSGSVTVQVFMVNVDDDEVPRLSPPSPKIWLKEGARSSTVVHVIQAFDPDGFHVEFFFEDSPLCEGVSSSTQCDIFALDQETGHITLSEAVSAGKANGVLNIRMVDEMSNEATGVIEVEYVGVNHPPQFDPCPLDVAVILEDEDINTPVINVTVVDEDSGSNGEVTFEVVKTAQGPYFDIRSVGPNTGELYSLESFNRGNRLSGSVIINGVLKYKVTVLVRDQGRPQLSTTCFMFVTVEDINNNDPIFDDPEYRVTILKETEINTPIIRVVAIDDDQGDNGMVTYSLTNSDECFDCFEVNPTTGWISIRSTIPTNLNLVTITATATDAGTPQRQSEVEVIITLITDVASLPPVWEPVSGVPIDEINDLEINEDVGLSYVVGLFTATLEQGDEGINYYLTRGRSRLENGQPDFDSESANSSMAVTVVTNPLPAEEVPQYLLKLRASRRVAAAPPYTDARLKVKIKDVNNKPPTFEGRDNLGLYSTAVSDKTEIGDLIITVIAIDEDVESPNNKVTYRWGDNCDPCAAFTIDEDSGEIRAAQEYDRADTAQYFLTVVAEDGDSSSAVRNSDEAEVVIQVLGPSLFPPEFDQTMNYQYWAVEGIPLFTSVANVTALDEDPEFNYPQYMIRNIQTANSRLPFSVETESGEIYTTGQLIYSEATAHTLEYYVFDGSETDSVEVHINITASNVIPPEFMDDVYTIENLVTEEDGTISANNPTILVTVAVLDDGYPITFSVEGEFAEFFQVNSNGEVSLIAPLDRDYPVGYENWQINVVATNLHPDGTTLSGYSILNLLMIDINDNEPKWDITTIECNIRENSPTNTEVCTVMAGDVDFEVNGEVTYILYETPQQDGQPLFSMDASGRITQVVGEGVIDRETVDHYELLVGAHDDGNPWIYAENQTIYITVTDDNDHQPYFPLNNYIFEVDEEIPVGGIAVDIAAIDEDIDDNAKLTFTIEGSGGDGDYFYFDSIYVARSGALKMAELIDFDEAGIRTLTFDIRVVDINSANFDTATVTITILDVNDNAPLFTPDSETVTEPENAPVNKTIASFTASDLDMGINGEFEFVIDHENTDPQRQFALEVTALDTVEVLIAKELDREEIESYELHVLAIDKGEPAMTGTGTVFLTLSDINDNAPDFAEGDGEVVVGQDTQSGQLVAEILGSELVDMDTDANGPPFTFSFECNQPECNDFTFQDSQTDADGNTIGQVIANRNGYNRNELGFKFYTIPILMTDNPTSNQPRQEATRDLIITVESRNDNRMSAGTLAVAVYTLNGMFDDVSCGFTYVEDVDDWDLPDKTFTCVSGCAGEAFIYFEVEPDTGEVIMKAGAPPGMNELKVEVYDDKWQETVTSTVRVQVIYIGGDALSEAGSVRLAGASADDFITRDDQEPLDDSEVEVFRRKIAELLNTPAENVEVLAVQDVPDGQHNSNAEHVIDVTFAAHGSPYYSSARLNGVVMTNMASIESALPGIDVEMSPVDLCLRPEQCFGVPCRTVRTYSPNAVSINTNTTAYAGVNTTYEAVCDDLDSVGGGMQPIECEVTSCLNGGACVQNHHGWTCDCMEGFEGPRCQRTKITFESNAWGFFDKIDQMISGRISFEFSTTSSNGVLIYNGPVTAVSEQGGVMDFIAVYIEGGYAAARINLGSGEVTLKVEASRVNDGRWHTIDIIKQDQVLRLVVDHCSNSIVDENINMTSEDRSMCEAADTAPGDSYLLNVLTPLELGGRSNPGVAYPVGLPGNGNFNGCLKNMRVNDKLYDLNVEDTERENLYNGCDAEGCMANGAAVCSGNSTCIGFQPGGNPPQCVCLLGYRGSTCEEETPELDFRDGDSFIEWELKANFNSSLSKYDLTVAALFVTRQESGLIFTAASFSRLEHVKVDIVDTHPRLRYDLGAGEYELVMDAVNASDGVWHKIYVERHGNHLWFMMDQSEGVLFKETLPIEEHRLLAISDKEQTYGGADVYYRRWHTTATVSHVLVDSCVSDIRINGDWLPLDQLENSASVAAEVVNSPNTQDTCDSNACAGVACPAGQTCVDYWRMPHCVCPFGFEWDGVGCIEIVDCSIPRCNGHGDCVEPATGGWYCHCYSGWYGDDCSSSSGTGGSKGGKAATLSTGAIFGIVIPILILLLLILLVLFFIMRRQQNEPLLVDPNDEIRENIVYYDEEGAGEEDMHAYDLSRLQKPIDDQGDVQPAYPAPTEIRPLGTAPEPMRKYDPAEYPDIGDFIGVRLKDADGDPGLPPYDSVREYEYEGGDSSAGSLSSLQTSSSGDLDFSYLNDFGPRFQRLADMYGVGQDDSDEEHYHGASGAHVGAHGSRGAQLSVRSASASQLGAQAANMAHMGSQGASMAHMGSQGASMTHLGSQAASSTHLSSGGASITQLAHERAGSIKLGTQAGGMGTYGAHMGQMSGHGASSTGMSHASSSQRSFSRASSTQLNDQGRGSNQLIVNGAGSNQLRAQGGGSKQVVFQDVDSNQLVSLGSGSTQESNHGAYNTQLPNQMSTTSRTVTQTVHHTTVYKRSSSKSKSSGHAGSSIRMSSNGHVDLGQESSDEASV